MLLHDFKSIAGFPEEGDLNALPAFRDRIINRHAAYRNNHIARMTRNYWYLLHRQWIRRDVAVYFDASRGYVYRDVTRKQNQGMPMPVTNYCSVAVEVELAAQTKRQWTPTVIPTSDAPDIEAAADIAKDYLTYSLDAESWPMLRDRFTWQTIVAGTGILLSSLDENYNELSLIAPGTEIKCVSCSAAYHSAIVPVDTVAKAAQGGANILPQTLQDYPSENPAPLMQMTACPSCGGGLEKFDLDPAQVKEEDPFGRQLGLHVPKAIPRFELIGCNEFFPENQGIDITPENMRRFGIRKVRSRSLWGAEHWPDRVQDISPMNPMMLMSQHPILGEWNYLGDYNYAYDKGIYDDHYWEDTLVELPSLKHPMGRLSILAASEVLFDGPLFKEKQDEEGNSFKCPRMQVFCARYKERPGEFWGESLLDVVISPQNRLNAGDAIDHDSMVRLGAPNILLPDDMDLTGPEWNPGYGSAKLMRYSASPSRPDSVPTLFGGQYFHDQWSANRKALIDDIQHLVGPPDVEIGEAPRNISTTSGLQVLGEQAERRRAPHERPIIAACEGAWEHRLQLLWAYAFDGDTYAYWVKDDQGGWAQKQFKRLMIKGQTKVKIEKQAYVDRSLFQREAAREAQADQLVAPDSPMARKRLLELRGLPTDVNEKDNRQVEHARRQWSDFINEQKVPVIDPTVEDPAIHFEVLGTMLFRDETKQIEQKINWPGILNSIAGWQDELMQAEQMDMQAHMAYGYGVDPASAAEEYAKRKIQFQQQEASYKQIQDAVGQVNPADAAGAAMPPPPMPPVPPVFLPPSKEQQVLQVWERKLAQQPVPPADPTAAQMQAAYIAFRSVVEGYRLYAAAAMQQMAPAPPPPATSAEPGTQPPPGGPQQPPAPPAPAGQPIRMKL